VTSRADKKTPEIIADEGELKGSHKNKTEMTYT